MYEIVGAKNKHYARKAFYEGDEKNCRIEYAFSEIIKKAMERIDEDYKPTDPRKVGRARHCYERLAFGIRLVEEKTRIGNCAIDFALETCDFEKIAFRQ